MLWEPPQLASLGLSSSSPRIRKPSSQTTSRSRPLSPSVYCYLLFGLVSSTKPGRVIGEAKGSGGFGISVDLTAIGADAALVHEAHTVRGIYATMKHSRITDYHDFTGLPLFSHSCGGRRGELESGVNKLDLNCIVGYK